MFLFNEFSSKATYNKGIQRCGIQPKNRKNYANTIILLNILKSFKCYIKKKKKKPNKRWRTLRDQWGVNLVSPVT